VGKKMVEVSPKSLDEAAKQVVGVTGILIGLYFSAITFGDLRGKVTTDLSLATYGAPVVLLLLSLIAAMLVFFPKTYQLNIHSSEASHLIYERTLAGKRRNLLLAAILLVLGILALLFALLTYLRG
jgi:hypothetical protein